MSRTPNSGSLLPGRLHATGEVNGFQIRPGLFLSNGAPQCGGVPTDPSGRCNLMQVAKWCILYH